MKHLNLTPPLYDYLLEVSLREHPTLKALRMETQKHPLAIMQIPPEQAQFMQLLIHTIQAKQILELGTFTGYSALAMALALPEDGRLITCDINEAWTSQAHHYWQEAHQDQKIELRLGPALDTLDQLLKDGYQHTFDLIFIDADKTNYVDYYERALQLIQKNGLIVIDNVLWHGKVIDKNETGGQLREIKRLNQLIKDDPRVTASLLPISDGLFIVKPANLLEKISK